MRRLLRVLLDEYRLKVEKIRRHPGGFQNDIFFVNTPDDDFTLRVYRTSAISRSELDFQFDVHKFLVSCHLPVQQPISTPKGEKYIAFAKDRICQLLTYLEGESAFPITKERIKVSGEVLGKFHRCGKNFAWQRYPKRLIKLRSWHKQLFLRKISRALKMRDRIPPKWQEATQLNEVLLSLLKARRSFNYLEHRQKKSWSWGLIHGDYHPGNLIFKDSKISGIFDFDQCGLGPFIWDIAFALAHYGFHLHHAPHAEIKKYFLSGYGDLLKSENISAGELRIIVAFAMAERLSASIVHFSAYPSKSFWKDEVTYYHHKLSEILI